MAAVCPQAMAQPAPAPPPSPPNAPAHAPINERSSTRQRPTQRRRVALTPLTFLVAAARPTTNVDPPSADRTCEPGPRWDKDPSARELRLRSFSRSSADRVSRVAVRFLSPDGQPGTPAKPTSSEQQSTSILPARTATANPVRAGSRSFRSMAQPPLAPGIALSARLQQTSPSLGWPHTRP